MITSLAIALAAASPQSAASPSPTPDYSQPQNWLCRPGRPDACSVDQTVTVVAPNGKRSVERFRAATNPGFDCFYVYPTVSMDTTPNSDMTAGPEEGSVIEVQAARFGSVCRVFAPLYRQVTITALRATMMGGSPALDRNMAYNDVKLAWDDYLARDNKGRGVVLIGHSQGSGLLKRLIAEQIDGKPAQARMISAMLLGTNVAVPAGRDVGGDFKTVTACRSATQVGCVISYVSFRAGETPPATGRFGRIAAAGQTALCTNPASLGGGKAVSRAIFHTKGAGSSGSPQAPWTTDGKPVTTPFVALPGLISTECVSGDGAGWLAVGINADPADPRTDTIGGDVTANGAVLKDWGLHLLDTNVAMGDLVPLAASQAKAWAAKSR